MKPSTRTMLSFYRQLGKLFYSVATADKTIRAEEVERLKQIVKSEWLPLENSVDAFGSDSAFQIEIVFDWLLENEWDRGTVIPDFKHFRIEHESLFTDRVKQLILKTAHAIADAFSGKNKSELVLIGQLQLILTKELSANY
jgi:hypothetical protein